MSKVMTEKEYMDFEGLRCPSCHAEAVEGMSSVEVIGKYAVQEVTCIECHAQWRDAYDRSGYLELEDENGESIDIPIPKEALPDEAP